VSNKQQPPQDFFTLYLQYTAQTECPTFFHRWTSLTCLAAWVGRDIYFPFGHFKIHANMYTMLVGLAGTKKSTAIKIGVKLLEEAGYSHFAADKTRQEKFLIDLADAGGDSGEDNILDQNLFGDTDMQALPPAECFVASDEINNFIGVGNLEFMSILGDFWDRDKPFKYKLKNSESVTIPYPTINILGGNTFVSLNRLFPPEAVEQGFFSRLLFIHAEPTGVKHTIPAEPSAAIKEQLIEQLVKIKQTMKGKIEITPAAFDLLDKIYHEWEGMNDIRFDAYENRRLQHLLKLCMLTAVVRLSHTIEVQDIIYANTILTFTEHLMPKALGEFGLARNSGVSHRVMQLLDTAPAPIKLHEIWKHVHTDLEKRDMLVEILHSLTMAEKIQVVNGGYLPIKSVRKVGVEGAVDWSLLSEAELDLL